MHIPESISSAGAILADSVEVCVLLHFTMVYHSVSHNVCSSFLIYCNISGPTLNYTKQSSLQRCMAGSEISLE